MYDKAIESLLKEVERVWDTWRADPTRARSPSTREVEGYVRFPFANTMSDEYWALIRLLRFAAKHGVDTLTEKQQTIIATALWQYVEQPKMIAELRGKAA